MYYSKGSILLELQAPRVVMPLNPAKPSLEVAWRPVLALKLTLLLCKKLPRGNSLLLLVAPQSNSNRTFVRTAAVLRSRQAAVLGDNLCSQVAPRDWRQPTQCLWTSATHKERSDSTAATTQTSCVLSDLQHTRSGDWRLSTHSLQ